MAKKLCGQNGVIALILDEKLIIVSKKGLIKDEKIIYSRYGKY